MTKGVMEQVKKELDELLANLGKANCLLSNSLIRQVLIKTILEMPEILIKDPDQSLPYVVPDALAEKAQRLLLKENWVKVLKEK